mmetsp:Transcript_1003/g.6283  ORF Transcript_1003/g.6283 Transcript_1003/m.6283 type:complete len:249 (-) Transcript_1003:2356-3102(-)
MYCASSHRGWHAKLRRFRHPAGCDALCAAHVCTVCADRTPSSHSCWLFSRSFGCIQLDPYELSTFTTEDPPLPRGSHVTFAFHVARYGRGAPRPRGRLFSSLGGCFAASRARHGGTATSTSTRAELAAGHAARVRATSATCAHRTAKPRVCQDERRGVRHRSAHGVGTRRIRHVARFHHVGGHVNPELDAADHQARTGDVRERTTSVVARTAATNCCESTRKECGSESNEREIHGRQGWESCSAATSR